MIKRGEIYYVDFGLSRGSEQGGIRPAIILQNNKGNLYSPTTIVVPITSKVKNNLPTHVTLKAGDGGLLRQSVALVEQQRVIDKMYVLQKMGVVSEKTMCDINNALDISLGKQEQYNTVAMFIGKKIAIA